MVHRVLHAPEGDGIDDVARHADGEEITEVVIEDQLGAQPAVRAGEHHHVWLLPRGQRTAPRGQRPRAWVAVHEATIARHEIRQHLGGGGARRLRRARVRRDRHPRRGQETSQHEPAADKVPPAHSDASGSAFH